MLVLSSIAQVNEVIQASQAILQSPVAAAIRFAASMRTLLEHVYEHNRLPLDPLDVATAMVHHVHTDAKSQPHVQYGQLKVTWGDLVPPALATAFAVPGGIQFKWSNNAREGNALSDDKCVLIVYCKKRNRFRFKTKGVERSTECDVLNIPDLKGEWVHTWISCRSANGKEVSDSVYTGKMIVV